MTRAWLTFPSGAVQVDGQVPVLSGAALAAYRANVAPWRPNAIEHGESLGVPFYWTLGMIRAESGGDATVISPDGGYGLMQLTARSVFQGHAPSETLSRPDLNIMLGTSLVSQIRVGLRRAGLPDDLPRVASIYNAGSERGVPHPSTGSWGMRETTGHIDRVITASNTEVLESFPGVRLAEVAKGTLARGPMSWDLRRADHIELLDQTFGNGWQILYDVHSTSPSSTCAIVVGMWAMLADIQARRSRPTAYAITTWAGFGGFSGPRWIPLNKLDALRVGDCPYWCGGTETTWYKATNGHIGVLIEGSGWSWITAEGGGGADGTLCRMSDKPKDVHFSGSRPLRGVFRPLSPVVSTSTFSPCKRGDRSEAVRTWQRRLLAAGYALPRWGADSDWGEETSAATESTQRQHGLPVHRDALDLATWNATVFVACKRGDKSEAVRTWQRRLLAEGFELPRWGADGDWGEETSSATEAVQRQYALPVHRDVLDQATWNALK